MTLDACLISTAGAEAPEAGNEAISTRVVTDAAGEDVVVPEHPECVVTLSEPALDGALSFGITPIGTVTGRAQWSSRTALQTKHLRSRSSAGLHNRTLKRSVRQTRHHPRGRHDCEQYPPVIEALRQIAPVVYTGYAGGNWRDNFTIVGDALNQQDEAQVVIATYDEKVAIAKASLGGYSLDRLPRQRGSLRAFRYPATVSCYPGGFRRAR